MYCKKLLAGGPKFIDFGSSKWMGNHTICVNVISQFDDKQTSGLVPIPGRSITGRVKGEAHAGYQRFH
jgi:hypothetical protein